jgi:hypothetical protein
LETAVITKAISRAYYPAWLEETIATTAVFSVDGSLSQALMTAFKSSSNAANGSCESLVYQLCSLVRAFRIRISLRQ